jgi:arabinogalactan endo-1,4-beta-galactosidase
LLNNFKKKTMTRIKKSNKAYWRSMLAFAAILSAQIPSMAQESEFYYGGDFSILKKMEDSGGVYKFNTNPVDALQLFRENGYSYGRVRIFHTPNMKGPVCNSLEYTIELSRKIKAAGMKLLLDFHYSDTWADPAKQYKPAAWKNCTFEALTDSVYHYSKQVIEAMNAAGVLPDMVQVGNEITPGMLWPEGKIYKETGEDWASFTTLLKAGIKGVKDAYGNMQVPIMLHIDKGGDYGASSYFFKKMKEHNVVFDLIGQSYYPWWHGTLDDLKQNMKKLSAEFEQDIIIVETAYYSNGYYPEPAQFVLDYKPFPSSEQGQFDFLVTLDSIARSFPKVKGIFYWEPEDLKIPSSGVWYSGRSLFDENGNAYKGISAFKK